MRPKTEILNQLCRCYCELELTDCAHEFVRNEIREHCQNLILTDDQVQEYMSRFLNCIKDGLRLSTHKYATVKCFPTYVQDLPNGKEKGKFLALDLGGTNFRVLIVNLAENKFDMNSKIYAVPQAIMVGTGEQLFDHIASCLADFMAEQHISNETLPLGFTFSFPCIQEGLTKGILKQWTKGFDCSGVAGHDVVQFLKEAINRRGDINIEVCAILNDTTGTLMSCAWKNFDCKIGVIVGTGSNACYVEQTKNCETFNGDRNKPLVIINCEWGAFGDNHELEFIRTEYDVEVDQNSINTGRQLHEKMVSGMYLGEIVRLVLVKLTKEKILFDGKAPDILFKSGSFKTKYISEIESDKVGVYSQCKNVLLNKLNFDQVSEQDCVDVRYICECISRRAAHLISAGVATLINKIPYNRVTVGVDGSVYRFHPHFHNLLVEKIKCLVKPGVTFDIMLSEDGSGRGAALVAAVASR
ncbi:hexokinase A isoform X3 [Lycorma delicatula]|uniref:hexokinase A isoform X3 n=1 Tax=Lycorma delicatula TaxID=130591 RepID=UPI003F51713F